MLTDQLQNDLNSALKTGQTLKRSVFGMVITALKNKAIAKQSALTELETQAVLASEVKKRKEAMEQFTNGNRPDLADKEKAEILILEAYLPAQLTTEQVRVTVKAIITQTGAKDIKAMGSVISAVMAKLQGQTDGGTVSRIVKEELAG